MDQPELLLAAYALGAVPATRLARIATAYAAKKAGLKPREIEQYNDATDGDTDGDAEDSAT